MFWDFAAVFYGIFEDAVNGKVNRRLCACVAAQIHPRDIVLECACGSGMITRAIAPRCKHLTATDFSVGMLRQFFPDAGFPAPEITVIRGRIPCAVAVLHGCQQTEQ